MRPANDGLRFVLELCALAAVAYWGWSAHGGIWRWVLVVAAPPPARWRSTSCSRSPSTSGPRRYDSMPTLKLG